MSYNETTIKGETLPENPSAAAFGQEVLWVAGVVIGATIVISVTRRVGRKVLALKNRNK